MVKRTAHNGNNIGSNPIKPIFIKTIISIIV